MSQNQRSGRQPAGGTQLFPTQNYLSAEVRAPLVELLNRTLADTTVLLTHAKFAHWNVKGLQFYALHQLFDEIAEVFERHADEIAERITALGGRAMGTARTAAATTTLPAMPTDAVSGKEYVELLADRLSIHDAALSEAIETAQRYGDADTADLLNEVSREVSQYLWFLEAHLQTRPTGTVESAGAADQPRQHDQPRQQGVASDSPSARAPRQF